MYCVVLQREDVMYCAVLYCALEQLYVWYYWIIMPVPVAPHVQHSPQILPPHRGSGTLPASILPVNSANHWRTRVSG